MAVRYGVLCLYCLALLLGMSETAQQASSMHISNKKEYALVDTLLFTGITHIYSDYWTCDRIIFQSKERIACSVLDDTLQPGQNRYPLYRLIVGKDAHASYVFHSTSPQIALLEKQIKNASLQYHKSFHDDYFIYQP